jgi:hypothetical protein
MFKIIGGEIIIIRASYVNIFKKLEIEESVFFFFASQEHNIIVTELKILCVDKNFDLLWKHGYHGDIIWNAEIIDDYLLITEYEEYAKYKLDLKTGKEI